MTSANRRPAREWRAAAVFFVVALTFLVLSASCRPAMASAEPARAAAGDEAVPQVEYSRLVKTGLLPQLASAPQIVVLGSSRAMRVNPLRVQTRTGHTAFNAAVTSGTLADAYCFIRLVRDTFPGSSQRYLWLLDVEQFRNTRLYPGILAQAELARYLPEWALTAVGAAVREARVTTHQGARESLGTAAGVRYGNEAVWSPDGFLIWNRWDYWLTKGRTLKKGLECSLRKYRSVYPRRFAALNTMPMRFAEETIRLMNEWGAEPVIVLTPYHPVLRSMIDKRGAASRRREVTSFFRRLRAQGLRLRLIDMTSVTRFHGWRSGFYDGTHTKAGLMARIVECVVRRAGDAL